MNYKLCTSSRGLVFGTLEEAEAARREICRKCGEVFAIESTNRKVTHIYTLSDTDTHNHKIID